MTDVSRLAAALAGRYDIEREIGAGGMATVYLARDVRHQRSVALKVLNPELGAVLGKERFLAEIQVTANLQHPNLLPLFDSGEAEGLLFYVMPFVEGESLRARLDREKQLPVDEAIRLAVAVAGALEYAHARGVIHRDLKPENILLQAGQPMIADFGIALAVSRAGGARITQTGLSLGTPQYMSPEQAAGDRVVDGRTDIYSLGAVTYEMLAGEPPHTGPTAQAIIAKLMTDEARPLPSLRRSVPTQIDVAVRHALEKLPADRFSTAGEFAESLQSRAAPSSSASFNAAESRAVAMATPGRMASVLQSRLWPAAFVITALAAVAATWAWVAARREQPGMTVRFPLTAGPNSFVLTSQSTAATTLAFAPDGRTIAFVNVAGNSRQLFLRTLNDVRTRAVAGTEGGEQPFFSPDGKWLGFVLGRQLMKVPVEGGSATRIADLTGTVYGVSWAPNDRIVVSTNNLLAVVPAAGGTARAFAPPDTSTREIAQWWPRALPDGRTVAYTSWRGSVATSRIALASLESGKVTDLHLPGTAPLGLINGWLAYVSPASALSVVPFDAGRLRTTGDVLTLSDQLWLSAVGSANADLSASGSIVFQSGGSSLQVVLAAPGGTPQPLLAEPRQYQFPRFSPDGARVALTLGAGGRTDIWIYTLSSGVLTRLTTEGTANDRPEWSADGTRVLFRTDREGATSLWWQPADGSGPAARLLRIPGRDILEGVLTPDGRSLVYRTGVAGSAHIWYRRLDGDTAAVAFAPTLFSEWTPRISPDGKWMAYSSDESGAFQVYVRPFPGPGARYQVSVDGGNTPVWSRDGRHLFYPNGQQLLSATLAVTPTFSVTAREKLLEGNEYTFSLGHASYDVAPDGKRFLLLRPLNGETQTIVVVNWREELRARTAHNAARGATP